MVFLSSAFSEAFLFYILVSRIKGIQIQMLLEPISLCPGSSGLLGKNFLMARAAGEQGGQAAVVRQKAEPVLRKRSNSKRNLSFLVIQADGVVHWGTTDSKGERGIGVSFLFMENQECAVTNSRHGPKLSISHL